MRAVATDLAVIPGKVGMDMMRFPFTLGCAQDEVYAVECEAPSTYYQMNGVDGLRSARIVLQRRKMDGSMNCPVFR